MMFVFLLLSTNFFRCVSPVLVSFLFMSLAPPITITVSLFPNVLISLSANRIEILGMRFSVVLFCCVSY